MTFVTGQILTAAELNTIEDRLVAIEDSYISVKDFGSIGNGEDATLAFSNAAKATTAGNSQELKYTNIDMCDWAVVKIPPGIYLLSSMVDTGNKEIVWDADAGAVIENHQYLNGRLLRNGSKISDYHHGTLDQAVTFSVMANRSNDEVSPIAGYTNPSDIAKGNGRDTVGFYAGNRLPSATYSTSSVTSYSSTGVVLATPLTLAQQYKMRVGMVITTKHATPYSSLIESWTDSTITVQDGWYLIDGVLPGVADTPTGTNGLTINAFRKAWAMNSNVHIDPDSEGDQINIVEFGLVNNKAETIIKGGTVEGTGVYSASIGSYYGDYAFLAAGKWDYGFRCVGSSGLLSLLYGVNSDNRAFYNVKADGSVEMGERGAASTILLDFHTGATDCDFDSRISATGGNGTSGKGALTVTADTLDIDTSGAVTITAGVYYLNALQAFMPAQLIMNEENANINLGKAGTTNTPFIDFHSSASSTDRDARISCSGGTASDEQGTISISAKQLVVPTLGNYADDAAAAAGGVPLNGLYRNGNVVQVRIV
jgi:hypothetical protein